MENFIDKNALNNREDINKKSSPMLIIDKKTGNIVDANLAALDYYAYSKEMLLTMNIDEINVMDKNDISKEIKKIDNSNRDYFRLKHKLSDGSIRDVEVFITPKKSDNKQLLYPTIHDITDIKVLEKEAKRNRLYFETFFLNSPEPIAIVDNNYRVLNINGEFEKVFQYSLKEIKNKEIENFLCPKANDDLSSSFKKTIISGQFKSEEVKKRRKDGAVLDVLLLSFPLVIEKEVIGAFFIFSDISKTKDQENKIEALTYYDGLTGMFNKEFFIHNLKNEIQKRSDKKILKDDLAILLLNSNEYKEISSALGQEVGDKVILEFVSRINKNMETGNIIARISENEFAIMIPSLNNKQDLNILTDNIIHSLDTPYFINEIQLQLTTNIGMAIYTDDGSEYDKLLRNAEIALEKSKETKKNCIIEFESAYDKEVLESFWIKTDLAQAVEKDELILHYQPIYDSEINKPVGIEALVRWKHKLRGIISPTEFIPIAEETGMIHPIGEWVLLQACKQNKKWQQQGYKPIYVSVNISILQLEKPGFIEMIEKALIESKLDPQYLQLEITETLFTNDYDQIKDTIKAVSNLGVRFAIDDFGTGYSSLVQLIELDIDTIKIDRAFVDGVDSNHNKSKIVKAIILLADSLGIGLIAEGAERIEEVDFLKENKSAIIQGFYYSKPLAVTKVEKLLEKGNTK